jgi:subtilisin family serine protease
MPSPEPPSDPPNVPVEEQFIVGFGKSTFAGNADTARLNVDTALSTLLDALPATLLKKFVGTAEDKAYCAIAVIRLDGTNPTLEHLQHEVASGKESNKPGYANIEWVETNGPVALSFNDPLSHPLSQWALPQIGVNAPFVAPPPGLRTIVAIVDSGLRLSPGGGVHADLDPLRVESVADSQPPFFYADNVDRVGHGTLLAGTIAAVTNNNLGIASAVHPGWSINLMAVKFFEEPGRPTAADAFIAIGWAALRFFSLFTGNRVKVINASWHVAAGGGGLVALRWITILAVNLGCVVVFAAGNDGTDNGIYPLFPANFTNHALLHGRVLTVLATDRYDNKAFFSNYGQAMVDIGAPGIHIQSTGRYLVPPARYSRYSGTSAAAAYVSAGAALVSALHPNWGPAQVVQRLLATADVVPQLGIACIGGRRLNLWRAINDP